jgi:hypothetical protein
MDAFDSSWSSGTRRPAFAPEWPSRNNVCSATAAWTAPSQPVQPVSYTGGPPESVSHSALARQYGPMDYSNTVATVALLISLPTGSVQVLSWWQARHRVSADCRLVTAADAGPDGELRITFYPTVTLRNAGGPNGVEDVAFKWLSPPGPPPEGFGWSNAISGIRLATEDEIRSTALAGALDVLGVRRTVADGEIVSWSFVLNTASREAAGAPQEFQAEVRLTSGKVIRTNKFRHQPVYSGSL